MATRTGFEVGNPISSNESVTRSHRKYNGLPEIGSVRVTLFKHGEVV